MIIDPALHGDSSGTLVILGNLQVDGVSTIIQSNTVSITDKNIVLADSATNTTEANGAGITVNGANASITYIATGGEKWEFNKAPYYLTNRVLTTADDLHDSAAVQGQIDSAVTLAFINSLDASATDWDSDLIPALRTDDVNEGTNLYYTNARARASVSGNKGLTYNSSTGVFDIDSANIYSFTIDSARTIGLIDSAYVEARIKQSFIDTFDTHDSAAVVGQITLEVDKAFIDALNVDANTLGGNDSSYYLDYNNFTNTPTLPAQVISYDSASELADSAVNARTDQDLFTTSDVEFAKVTSNLVGSVHFIALNDEGTALAKGDVVYLKGISGNTPTVAKADADDATKMPAFGVVETGANNAANVTITTLSVLDHFDTQTPGWSEGDTLYVSTVAGQLTNTKPTGESSLIQNMGHVTKVDTTNGQIKVVGAGRTAATPNLDLNRIFIGNASGQSITMSLDSAVDSDHVQSKIKQSFINTFDTHDSAAVAGQIADTLNDTVTITKHSTTDPVLKLQSTVSTSDAAPIMEFVRNTNQANNGDYLGQIKFLGEDSSGTANGSGIVYAKMTGKIADPTDGTEDGLIEYMVKSNGSNLIMARMTGNSGGKLIMENGAGIEVASGNITIAGNTVLTTASDTHDSAAVQGQIDANFATGFTVGGDITFSDSDDLILPDNSKIKVGDASDLEIYHDGNHSYIVDNGTGQLRLRASAAMVFQNAAGTKGYATFSENAGALLYYNGGERFETADSGAYVTGEVLVSTLTPSTDSALATKSYVDANAGGTSSSHTVAIGLLGAGLDVGDPVYYDSDAVKWVGAVDSDDGVASHIIVEKNTGVDFKIAQTGVFTLTPHQGLDINSYYFTGSTIGAATNTQPTVGINQPLFYALDSSTIDINIAEATDLSATNASSTILGTTAAAPAPNVDGDTDTGLFSAAANTLSVSAGGTEISSFSSTGLEVKSGVGIPKYVSLSQGGVGAGVTYNIDAGNTASLTTDSDKTITLTTTGGNFTGLGGTSATLLIKNNTSPDSDRTMTFVTSSGNTLHFNSANTLTVAGGKISIVSAMVFGNNDLVLSAVSLDSSVTY